MSKYSYAGSFVNPTTGWTVEFDEESGTHRIMVPVFCECGHECCDHRQTGTRPHTSAPSFEDEDAPYEWIEAMRESAETDYDDYLEENHDSIYRQELYESFQNEY